MGKILHRDIDVIIGHALVENARHVLILHAADDAVFADEAFDERIGHQLRAEHLEHHLFRLGCGLAQPGQPLGEEHLGGAAFADLARQPVAADLRRVRRRGSADGADIKRQGLVVAIAVGQARARQGAVALAGTLEDCIVDRGDQAHRSDFVAPQVVGGAQFHRLHRNVFTGLVRQQNHRRQRLRALLAGAQPFDPGVAFGLMVEQQGVVMLPFFAVVAGPGFGRRSDRTALRIDGSARPVTGDVRSALVAQAGRSVNDEDAHGERKRAGRVKDGRGKFGLLPQTSGAEPGTNAATWRCWQHSLPAAGF